jgi:hypothetical protein
MKYYTSTTQFNCGIDLHAHQMYVCLMDRDGKKLLHTNIRNNDFAYFLQRLEPYRHDLTVVCECMFGWYWLADACQAAGLKNVSKRVSSDNLQSKTCQFRQFAIFYFSCPRPQTMLHHARAAHAQTVRNPIQTGKPGEVNLTLSDSTESQ